MPVGKKKLNKLRVADIPGRDEMITLVEGLLDDLKNGKTIVSLAVVALRTNDGYDEAVVAPPGTRVAMIGALQLLQHRMLENVIDEHDGRA